MIRNTCQIFALFFIFNLSFLLGQEGGGLQSGEAIRNNDIEGYTALPFLSGKICGAADLDMDGTDDIFLQSSKTGQVYIYKFLKLSKDNTLVYQEPKEVRLSNFIDGEIINENATIIENDRNVFGLFGKNNYINITNYDKDAVEFKYRNRINIIGLPSAFTNFGIIKLKSGKFLLLFAVREQGVFSAPRNDPNRYGYNLEGFWTFPLMRLGIYGCVVENLDTQEARPKQLTTLDQVFFALNGFSKFEKDDREWLLVGARTGVLYAYQIEDKNSEISLGAKRHVVNKQGIIQKNPAIQPSLSYVNTKESAGIVTVGEGGIYFYNDLKKIDEKGNLVFGTPNHVLQENTYLTAGSLPVPSIVDWDGDGVLDIISGTSMGFVYYYKNIGTNQAPKYINPVLLESGGKIIQTQGGYRGSVQGPSESRWGYICPTVFDWNGDGLPDLITGDINAEYMVYLNIGTKDSPKLDSPVVLQVDGIDVIGTWRVRPGVAKVGETIWFVNQDRNDDLHLYYALDTYNLEDKGKLTLKGGVPIRASYHDYQGLIGRGKYEVVDWDDDGKVDILIGTYLNHAFPDKTNGLPFSLLKKGGKKEAMVLFLRNIGTNDKPVFDFPKPLKFKGEYIHLGVHACSPSATTLGGNGELNLVVGEENGKFIFYKRQDLSW